MQRQPTCPACDSEALKREGEIGIGTITAVLCLRCGVLFCDPMPAAEAVDAYYAPDGAWQQHEQPKAQRDYAASLVKTFAAAGVDLTQGGRVLDFGCGSGKLLDGLRSLGWHTAGIEPATRAAFDRHRELTALPAAGDFDLVIAHHVLEHLPHPAAILPPLVASVRIGGHLLISVPYVDDLCRIDTPVRLGYYLNGQKHLVAYPEASLRMLLAMAGCEVIAALPKTMSLRVVARRTDTHVPLPRKPQKGALAVWKAWKRQLQLHRQLRQAHKAANARRLAAGDTDKA